MKNVATKQDIQSITNLVECAKSSFTNQTEILKSKLSLLTNIQTGFVAEERNAIVDYVTKFHQWFNKLTETSLGNIDRANNENLAEYLKVLSSDYNALLVSEAKLDTFVENKDLIGQAEKIKLMVAQSLEPNVHNFIIEFMNFNNTKAKMVHSGMNSNKANVENPEKRIIYHQDSSVNKILEECKRIKPEIIKFRHICRKHINDLYRNTAVIE